MLNWKTIYDCGGERAALPDYVFEFQRVTTAIQGPFQGPDEEYWQARAVHRSGAVIHLRSFRTPDAARKHLEEIAENFALTEEQRQCPSKISTAQSVQADIEVRRMAEIKELLARER